MKRHFLIFLALSLAGLPGGAHASNKVITKNYRWQLASTEHFDIYHYGRAGEELLPRVTVYLEKAARRTQRTFPRLPKDPSPFFLYNTHNDFEESNIAEIGEYVGGVTEAFKNRFIVGHIGSQRYLERVIAHEYMHEIEYEYLFSGFWRSVRLLKFIVYPGWLMEGMAEYVSGDLDETTREMYLRDAATSNRLLSLDELYNFNHLLPHQVVLAYKESEAFIRYLADEYGEDKLPRLLESYQERFEADAVLDDVLGSDLPTLDFRFREYLADRYAREAEGLAEPGTFGRKLTKSGPYPRFREGAVFSPDGKSVAYLSDETGSEEIYLLNLKSGAVRRLWDIDRSLQVENIHTDGGGLAFSPDGRFLAFAGERLQKDYLFLYELASGALREIDTRTDTVASPAFSPDGATVYFSGLKDGARDLYALALAGGKLARLTEGPMDEIGVAASPDGTSLVFSAERPTMGGAPEYDLCRLELATGKVRPVVVLPGHEMNPSFSPDGKNLYFVSDQDGVFDIYRRTEGGDIERLTRVIGGAFQPVVSPDGAHLLFASYRRGEKDLYLAELEQLAVKSSSPLSLAVDVPRASAIPVLDVPSSDFSPRAGRPRGGFSTDLFFPALFYSTLDGLSLAAFWQGSDFYGDHRLQSIVSYASAAEYLDYQLVYGFVRNRLQWYAALTGEEYAAGTDLKTRKKEHAQSVTAVYPLNRFEQLQFLLGTVDRRELRTDDPAVGFRLRENVAGISFIRDTVRGPYLEATEGWRLMLSSRFADRVLSGDYRYQNYMVESRRLFPLGGEHALSLRTFLGGSFGEDAGLFRLGGADRVRGVPEGESYAGTRVFVNNLEWRFPLSHNLNYHMWYFFPDFFFKTLTGTVFMDVGTAWNEESELEHLSADDWKAGGGVGLRFNTFILESYPLLLQLQLAHRMDTGQKVFYFSLGTGF